MSAGPILDKGGPSGRLFPLEAHLVSHTHWDREWYQTAGRFRQRLVALIDELLDAPLAKGAFLLDGQTILLEDYLAVRPDRAAELSAQLRESRLEAGPWYVLADELIPSGEALVRNLLAGRRALRALRAESPPVLYCPDSFGHPAALPAIAQGFGLGLIVLWRGFGGARWPSSDVVRWRAPDGSTSPVYHLPPSGYEAGANLPTDSTHAAERWRALRESLGSRSGTGVVLLPNGADHHARQHALDEAATALQSAAAPDQILRSSLRTFASRILATATTSVPEITGELRDSYGYTWTLQGTFATRAAQKRRNAIAERTLVRETEPWVALAMRNSRVERRSLLESAWRTLLRCHPHDTLCGCSIDDVAGEMDVRLADAQTQAEGLRDDALASVLGHDAANAHVRRDEWRPVCVVRNAAARRRGGVAEVVIDTPLYRVPVGPGSHGAAPARVRRSAVALDGGRVPLQILTRTTDHLRSDSPRHYPVTEMTERTSALAWVEPVGGYGTVSHQIRPGRRAWKELEDPVRAEALTLSNSRARVTVEPNGAVRYEDLGTGRKLEGLLAIEDVGDGGDLYTHSPLDEPVRESRCVGARLLHRGPLRGEIVTSWRVRVPAMRIRPSATGSRSRASNDKTVTLPIEIALSLDAGAPWVRVAVRGRNLARDHRLRIVFATGITEPKVFADAAFGIVERRPITVSLSEAQVEMPPRTAPLHRYVSLFDAKRGATVFSDGLAEYEATATGDVAITLVRAVGQLSRNDLPERPGHAGWPSATPDAQSPGHFEATFALMLHGARTSDVIDDIERTADDVLLPLRGTTLRTAITQPAPTAGIELQGRGLTFSSAKPSEDGRSLVLRCVNLTGDDVRGSWRVDRHITRASIARLDETPLTDATISGDTVEFAAAPHSVVTVLVE